ncbi:Beta-lactamase-like [Penicillium digitatum]|nr:Beta-lactamase-like [Penicillium digitatum]
MFSIRQQSSCAGWQFSSDLLRLSSRPIRTSMLVDFGQLRHIQHARTGVPHTPKSSRNGASIKGQGWQAQKEHLAHGWNQPFSQNSCSIPINPTISHRVTYNTASTISTEPVIHDVFEPASGTWQYLIADPSTSTAVIIDPVLNYDPATQAVTTEAADSLLSLIMGEGYKIDKILETHAHADHLSAASYLQKQIAQCQDPRPPICIGKRIEQVQKLFAERYGVPQEEYKAVFDKLFDDDETFTIGNLKGMAMHLPGHTPDHLGYMIGANLFCGDSLFHVDIGTARCDFPGGDANDLFRSGRKLLSLPDHFKIWTGHDYPPEGRDPVAWVSVQDHKKLNKHLKDGIGEEEFVALRKERDAGLEAPKLLHQSLQVNIRAGHLPLPSKFGHRLLHLPMKLTGEAW